MSTATPYFGRQFKLTVLPQATGETWTIANSSWKDESLRVTFECEQATFSRWFSADIVIWNINLASAPIQQNDLVTLEAGYESPGARIIFSGRVFQPIWERADDVNYTLTLHCVLGIWEDLTGYVNVPLIGGITQAEAVRQVARAANIQCLDDNLDPVLSSGPLYPRGAPFSGIARAFFDKIGDDNHLNTWIDLDGVHIVGLPTGTLPGITFAPSFSPPAASGSLTKYTLIGTPQQTQMGVCFRTLLDPQIKLNSLVGLKNVIQKQVSIEPMKTQVPYWKDGVYAVAGIKHTGDTRGNDWYTEVNCLGNQFEAINQRLYLK